MLVKDNPYIPQEDKDFFFLLRIGLWQQVGEEKLSPYPNWVYIYQLACEQAIQGIIADGIGLYRKEHPELRITQEQNDKFLSASAQIVRQNFNVNHVQAKLCEILAENGIPYVVLKGQGVAQSYPKPTLRCSGDIDYFFTPDNYKHAKELLKPLATEAVEAVVAKEQHYTIDGVEIELHALMYAGINNACDAHFQKLVADIFNAPRHLQINDSKVSVPSDDFDALYILIHTIRHLGAFGISLRQVIDWTMHMHSCHKTLDKNRLQSDIESMHLQNLWALFMSFATEWLGMEVPEGETPADNKSSFKGNLEGLWQVIKSSGSFGHKNDYFKHDKGSHLEERLSRIYYRTLQALKLRQFDREFSNYLLRHELKDTIIAPFRFLFGGPTKIQ